MKSWQQGKEMPAKWTWFKKSRGAVESPLLESILRPHSNSTYIPGTYLYSTTVHIIADLQSPTLGSLTGTWHLLLLVLGYCSTTRSTTKRKPKERRSVWHTRVDTASWNKNTRRSRKRSSHQLAATTGFRHHPGLIRMRIRMSRWRGHALRVPEVISTMTRSNGLMT